MGGGSAVESEAGSIAPGLGGAVPGHDGTPLDHVRAEVASDEVRFDASTGALDDENPACERQYMGHRDCSREASN